MADEIPHRGAALSAQRSAPVGRHPVAGHFLRFPARTVSRRCAVGDEIVLISEEKTSPRQHSGDLDNFGGIITYFPVVRLADFYVGHQERFGVLALQVHASRGGEKLEIIFPSNDERAVAKAMEQVLVPVAGS